MPLVYDDIPGSWGMYSVHWPKLSFATEEEAKWAYIACTKTNLVPYGSYVLVAGYGSPVNELRIENDELLSKLSEFLAETPHKTYDTLRQHFIDTGAWSK